MAGDFSESEDSKEDDSQSLIVEKESHWAKIFFVEDEGRLLAGAVASIALLIWDLLLVALWWCGYL